MRTDQSNSTSEASLQGKRWDDVYRHYTEEDVRRLSDTVRVEQPVGGAGLVRRHDRGDG